MDLRLSQSQTQNLHVFFFFRKEVRFVLSFLILLISTVVISSLVSPFDPQFVFRFGLFSQFLPNNSNTSSVGACDYSYGRWVGDESYTLDSYTENCSFLDPGFRCTQNGRKDDGYRRWRWQPAGCDLPRLVSSSGLWQYVPALHVTPCMLVLFLGQNSLIEKGNLS